MDLTVIIPSYNSSGHLADSLRTLEAMASAGAEVVLIDDGSEDDTVKVFSELTRDWPAARAVQTSHRGLAATRNRGVLEASRKFLAFLDSDDSLCLEGVREMLNDLERSAAPAVRGGEISREVGQVPECRHRGGERKILKADRVMLEGFGGTLRFIYRRDFLIAHGLNYPENLGFAEDLVFYVRLAMACPEFVDINVDFYCYTVGRAGQMTAKSRADSWNTLPASLEMCIAEASTGSPELRASVAAMVRWYAIRGLPQVDSEIRRLPKKQLKGISKSARRQLGVSRLEVNRRLLMIGLSRVTDRLNMKPC